MYPLHHSPSSPSPPIPGLVSTDLIFPFTYMCTQYLHYIHPPTPFPHLLPALLVPTSPQAGLFLPPCSPIFEKKEKNDIFICLRWLHKEFPCDISMYICIVI
jgi:hypothetical protein